MLGDNPRPSIPAIVTAGDRGAAKSVGGTSKVYLQVGGSSLVERVITTLQRVPEISEIWVVGDAKRLKGLLQPLEYLLNKPLHIVPQFRNLHENAWQTYRRALPDAGPDGRDPTSDDAPHPYLFLSADLPFATPQEISAFIKQGLAEGCDYALGLVTAESLAPFADREDGMPAIELAYFNVLEGRLRQSNLHLVRPYRFGNRHLIQEMYEHRYQREFGHVAALAWRLAVSEGGGFALVYYYAIIHLAGWADRHGWHRLAEWFGRRISLARVERGISALLRTRYRFVVTRGGGCGIDVDNLEHLEASRQRFEEWTDAQAERVKALYGDLPSLPRRPTRVRIQVHPEGKR